MLLTEISMVSLRYLHSDGESREFTNEGEGGLTITFIGRATMREQQPCYKLVEESEQVREAHDDEDMDCDSQVWVGVRAGGLTRCGGFHGGYLLRVLDA